MCLEGTRPWPPPYSAVLLLGGVPPGAMSILQPGKVHGGRELNVGMLRAKIVTCKQRASVLFKYPYDAALPAETYRCDSVGRNLSQLLRN